MSLLQNWKKEFARLLKSHIITFENGLISKLEYRNEYGELHRNPEIGPAVIYYYENGNIRYKSYWVNGKKHRLEGPAYISYYENGNIRCESYWVNSEEHRLDGPAYIEYHENGNIHFESYLINGKIHRLDGPAVINYYENGTYIANHIGLTVRNID